MTTRWMIAAAGAVGVGVLTASGILGPTRHVQVAESSADAEHGGGGCQADKQANLDFTLKDMNGADVRLATTRGRSS